MLRSHVSVAHVADVLEGSSFAKDGNQCVHMECHGELGCRMLQRPGRCEAFGFEMPRPKRGRSSNVAKSEVRAN